LLILAATVDLKYSCAEYVQMVPNFDLIDPDAIQLEVSFKKIVGPIKQSVERLMQNGCKGQSCNSYDFVPTYKSTSNAELTPNDRLVHEELLEYSDKRGYRRYAIPFYLNRKPRKSIVNFDDIDLGNSNKFKLDSNLFGNVFIKVLPRSYVNRLYLSACMIVPGTKLWGKDTGFKYTYFYKNLKLFSVSSSSLS